MLAAAVGIVLSLLRGNVARAEDRVQSRDTRNAGQGGFQHVRLTVNVANEGHTLPYWLYLLWLLH